MPAMSEREQRTLIVLLSDFERDSVVGLRDIGRPSEFQLTWVRDQLVEHK